jgi:hypothetical protein
LQKYTFDDWGVSLFTWQQQFLPFQCNGRWKESSTKSQGISENCMTRVSLDDDEAYATDPHDLPSLG